MKQKNRNKIAIKIARLLKEEKANIFDCLDILQNIQEDFIKELEFNIKSNSIKRTKKLNRRKS